MLGSLQDLPAKLAFDLFKGQTPPMSLLPVDNDRSTLSLAPHWNSSIVDHPQDLRIHELFQERVKASGRATALTFEGQAMTYSALNRQANRLAHYLRSKGIGAGDLVPVCMGPCAEMIISILGILKAGAAYVPLDPEQPEERLAYLLADTKAMAVITDKKNTCRFSSFPALQVLTMGKNERLLAGHSGLDLDIAGSATDLAYVIYTSGTTGRPKGVMIEHRALSDHCYGLIDRAGLRPCRSFALFSPLAFDAGHSIIHSCLLLGAELHVLSKELIMDAQAVVTYLIRQQIDCIKLVPSLWLFYTRLQKVALAKKVIIFGGEVLPPSIPLYLRRCGYQGAVYNHYGPTETTIGKCIYRVPLDKDLDIVPIGRPFSNTEFYVLDENLSELPVGQVGELYIAGKGLARGYLNMPELTALRFVHVRGRDGCLKRMYRTGDRVKWSPEGELVYLGRVDEQLKISGHRIEPAEIEQVSLQSGLVEQAAVIAFSDADGNPHLVQFVVPVSLYDRAGLTAQLKRRLPAYMVPVATVELDGLPMNSNGKIDRSALAALARSHRAHVMPSGPVETRLVKIWETVLGSSHVGANDDFFELSGDSMLVAIMFAKIKQEFKKTLPLATIFCAPTVRLLAVRILATEKHACLSPAIIPIQPLGNKAPLFCLHAGHGHVLFYKELARQLGEDQPFYGIQARGIEGNGLPFDQMEAMAAYYVAELRKIQPEGPYQLGGYCLGP